jgi:hypothetical protein
MAWLNRSLCGSLPFPEMVFPFSLCDRIAYPVEMVSFPYLLFRFARVFPPDLVCETFFRLASSSAMALSISA